MRRQGLYAQESIFWSENGRFCAKRPNYFVREQKFWYSHIRKPMRHLGRIVLLAKNANVGPNLAVFGPKILIFMGTSKSFGTHITENHSVTWFALFLAWDEIWPFLPRPKIHF